MGRNKQDRSAQHKTGSAEYIAALCETAMQIRYNKSRRALKLVSRALKYAEKLGDQLLIADCCYTCGEVYILCTQVVEALPLLERAYQTYTAMACLDKLYTTQLPLARINALLGNPTEARRLLEESLQYFTESGNTEMQATALIRIGELHMLSGSFELALENTLAALQLTEKHGYQLLMLRCYQLLGLQYFYMGEIDMEEVYCHKALQQARMLNNIHTEHLILLHFGNKYLREGKLAEVRQHLEQIDLTKLDRNNRYPYLNTWAQWYSKMGYKKKAALYRKKAMNEVRRQGVKLRTIGMFLDAGDSVIEQKEYTEAIDYWEAALEIAQELENKFFVNESSRRLADAFQAVGEIEESLEYYKLHMKASKEIFDEEKQKIVAEMQAKFDVESADREKELFRAKNAELTAAFAEVQRLNENLTRLNNEKNEVLGVVAHDLKGPLAGVRMVASLLQEHCRAMPVEELEGQLAQIVETSDRMLAISSNLLYARQLELADTYEATSFVNISEVIKLIAESYRPAAARKNIALLVEHGENIGLACSGEALRRVAENLISNAVKFTPANGEVRVRVKQAQSKIVVEVEDQGPGIAKSDQRKLYGKYSRLSAQPTGGESSTGLGLWIAKKAVDTMKGRIKCVSNIGRGTTFVFEIPM